MRSGIDIERHAGDPRTGREHARVADHDHTRRFADFRQRNHPGRQFRTYARRVSHREGDDGPVRSSKCAQEGSGRVYRNVPNMRMLNAACSIHRANCDINAAKRQDIRTEPLMGAEAERPPTPIVPLNRRTLHDELVDRVRTLIVEGQLLPEIAHPRGPARQGARRIAYAAA